MTHQALSYLLCVGMCGTLIVFLFASAGLLGFGWTGPSLCSTAMNMECWAPSLRRWRPVSALRSSPPARESFRALWAPRPPPAPPVPLTTQPAVDPVTTATSYILVPAGQALLHLWTTISTWIWTCLILRFSEILLCVSLWFSNICGPNSTVSLTETKMNSDSEHSKHASFECRSGSEYISLCLQCKERCLLQRQVVKKINMDI